MSTTQPVDNRNIFEKFIDNIASGFGSMLGGGQTALVSGATSAAIAKTAGEMGAPSELNVQAQATANEAVMRANEKANSTLFYPYKQFVARPLSTAFLANSPTYQKQVGAGFFDENAWKSAWNDAQHVSPGQSIVGFVGSLVDGTQGTDKIDWTKSEDVNTYFNHGPQRWISFSADALTYSFLDPFVVAGKGVGRARRKYVTNPVTTYNAPKIINKIDEATVSGKTNEWTTFINFLKKNSDNRTAILSHRIVKGNNDLADVLMTSAKTALATGNDSIIGDALKIGIGDSASIEKALYESTQLSDQVTILTKKKRAIQAQLRQSAKNPQPPMGSKQGLLDITRRNTVKLYKQQIADANINLNAVEKISEMTAGKIQQQTVSKFNFLEERAAKSAENFASSYWTQDIGPGTRVLHYLEPSAMLHERPSNVALIGGIGGDRSHLEFAARVRQWAKLTGKPMAVAERYFNIYANNLDKTSRLKMLNDWDEKATRDIIIARLKETGPIPPHAQKAVADLADMIAKNTRIHKNKLFPKIVERDFTILDETGSEVFVKHLSDYVESCAQQLAAQMAGGAKNVTPGILARARDEARLMLQESPVRTSQLPNLHYAVDMERFNDIVASHATELRAVVDEILTNPRFAGMDAKSLYEEFTVMKSKELIEPDQIPAFISERTRANWDLGIEVLDRYYNEVWKPITLMSLHYTSRNVAEGWQRMIAVAAETARDTGMSFTQILKDSYSPGSIIRKRENMRIKHDANKMRKELTRRNKEFRDLQYQHDADISGSLYATSDSLHASLVDTMDKAYNVYLFYGNIKFPFAQQVVSDMSSMIYRITDTASLPKGVNPELFESISTGNTAKTFDILASSSENSILVTLDELSKRINDESALVNKHLSSKNLSSLPYGMQVELSGIASHLNQASLSIQSVATASVAKAAARGELESLIGGFDILHNITKSAEGQLKLSSNLELNDAFAGVVGAIMRGEVDAIRNATRTTYDIGRATMEHIISKKTRQEIIPPMFVDANGNKVVNINWAQIAADYANRQLRDAVTQKLLKIDVNDPAKVNEVIRWAKSKDPEAKRWRELMSTTISIWKGKGIKRPIDEIVRDNAIFVDGHLPERSRLTNEVIDPKVDANGNFILDANGDYIPGLRDKGLAGELTATDMLKIPERERTATYGATTTGEKGMDLWHRFTATLFKHLGSNPETRMVRHPFYVMMYRTEARRIVNLWKEQGRSEDWINANIERVQQAAHEFAYKNVMEKLYSIERKTDPATALRFMSPFYMAKQNSNRFWFGYYKRNPGSLARYFQLWSAATRVFDVEDETGRDVTFVNPFAPAGASVMLTLPESVSNHLGVPKGTRFNIYLSSFDLINNGYMPFVPEIGGKVTQIGTGWLLDKTGGTSYDPELFLTKLGIKPDIITKHVLPYYRPEKETSPRDALLNALIDPNSWMNNVLIASTGKNFPGLTNIANFADSTYYDKFNARLMKNFAILEADFMGDSDPLIEMSSTEQSAKIASLLKDAAALTVNEYTLEAFVSGGATVGTGKFENISDRISKELRQYQNQYGQDEGMTRYIQFLSTSRKDAEELVSVATFSPRETNMFGVSSTPQTLHNIMSNKKLWDDLHSAATGQYGIASSKMLGQLFNGGDRLKDYTPSANAKLFKIGAKKVVQNPKDLATEMTINIGSDMYYSFLDKCKAEGEAMQPPVLYGTKDFEYYFKDKLDAKKKEISNKNPLWKFSDIINPDKYIANVFIIDKVLSDKNYVNTVVKNNPMLLGLSEYMAKRPELVELRKKYTDKEGSQIYSSAKYSTIVIEKEKVVNDILKKYPEFKDFYNYYLSHDPLLPVFQKGVKSNG